MSASFFTQTFVYFKKLARISMREKVWIFVGFAVIISLLVTNVTAADMFENFEDTKMGFFTLTSACIWIGIFNSIQSICKEHDIIRSDYRQGMKLSSYVMANVFWQFVLCLVQSLVIFFICVIFGFFGDFDFESYCAYFFTILILTFGAAVLGIMVSSIAGTPTTAMKIMPFVLILQLILCGVLFELEGIKAGIAYITYSKWGMSAFGSIANMNHLSHKIVLEIEDSNIANVLKDQFEAEDLYKHNLGTLLWAWGWCIGLTIFCTVTSWVSLAVRNRDS